MADTEGGPVPTFIDPPTDTLAELWQSVRRDLHNARTELGHWRQRAEKAEAELRILKDTLTVMRERTGALRHEHGVVLDELATRTMERDHARDQAAALLELARWRGQLLLNDQYPPSVREQDLLARCRDLGADI